MIPFPDKKYKIIYADPPWDMRYVKGTKEGIRCYDMPYPVMSDEEIMALPVKNIAEDNSILFMWVIDSRIPKIKELMSAWGFEYITVGFVWNKKAENTLGYNAILSQYTRKSCEFCFIGRKGEKIVNDSNVDQFISESKKEHSKKPRVVRERILQMCGNISRIELFSRDKIEGWDCWGNEIPSSEQVTIKRWTFEEAAGGWI